MIAYLNTQQCSADIYTLTGHQWVPGTHKNAPNKRIGESSDIQYIMMQQFWIEKWNKALTFFFHMLDVYD